MANKTTHNFVLVGKDRASKALKGVSKSTKGLLTTTFELTNTIAASIRITEKFVGGIRKVGSAVNKTVSEFAELEKGMMEVGTITTFSTEELEALGKEVNAFAGQYALEATDATKALYQAISAGVDQDAALFFLEDAAKLATGGIMEASTSVDILTSVVNAYGMDVEEVTRVSDILFTTVKMGVTTGEELAASLGQVTPIAAGAGVSFEDLSSAMALLTKGGLSTAEATTALKALITSIAAPTDQARTAIEELGLAAFNEQALKQKGGLFRALQELNETSDGTVEALTDVIPNIRALTGALSLGGQMGAVPEIMDAMATSAGATEEAFDKMTKTFAFRQDQLIAKFNGLLAEIGRLVATNPQLQALFNEISNVIDTLTKGLVDGTDGAGAFGEAVSDIVSFVIPALIEAVAFLADTFAGNTGLSVAIDIVNTLFKIVGASVMTLVNTMQILWRTMKLVKAVFTLSGSEIQQLKSEIADLSVEIADRAVGTFESVREEWNDGSEKAGELAESLREMGKRIRTAGEEATTSETAIEPLIERVEELGDVSTDTAESLGKINKELSKMGDDSIKELNRDIFKYLDGLRGIPGAYKAWNSTYADLRKQWKELSVDEQIAKMEEFKVAVQGVFTAATGSEDASSAMGHFAESAEDAARRFKDAMEDANDDNEDDTKETTTRMFDFFDQKAVFSAELFKEQFKRSAESGANSLANEFSDMWQSQALDPTENWGDKWGNFTDNIKAQLTNALVDPFLGANGPVGDFFNTALSYVSDFASGMMVSIQEYFAEKFALQEVDQATTLAMNTATTTQVTAQNTAAGAASAAAWTPAAVATSIATLGAALAFGFLVSAVISKVMGYEDGGFIDTEQLAMLGEGNKPEVVIPLTKPDRARSLLAETFDRHPELFISALSGNNARQKGTKMGESINMTFNITGQTDPTKTSAAIVDKINHQLGSRIRGKA